MIITSIIITIVITFFISGILEKRHTNKKGKIDWIGIIGDVFIIWFIIAIITAILSR
jgi:hypothetical protein